MKKLLLIILFVGAGLVNHDNVHAVRPGSPNPFFKHPGGDPDKHNGLKKRLEEQKKLDKRRAQEEEAERTRIASLTPEQLQAEKAQKELARQKREEAQRLIDQERKKQIMAQDQEIANVVGKDHYKCVAGDRLKDRSEWVTFGWVPGSDEGDARSKCLATFKQIKKNMNLLSSAQENGVRLAPYVQEFNLSSQTGIDEIDAVSQQDTEQSQRFTAQSAVKMYGSGLTGDIQVIRATGREGLEAFKRYNG
jgi:flagellar biosynthesis GTPase FlhF